jgi:hypothetical protein
MEDSSSNVAQAEGPVSFKLTQLEPINTEDFASIPPSTYAREYLKSCYPESGLFHDSKLIIDFIVKHQDSIGAQSSLLDVGSASVISYAVAIARNIDKVLFSDIYTEHLALIDEWVKKDKKAHNWSKHIEYVLESEKEEVTPNNIDKRQDRFRKKVNSGGLVIVFMLQNRQLLLALQTMKVHWIIGLM